MLNSPQVSDNACLNSKSANSNLEYSVIDNAKSLQEKDAKIHGKSYLMTLDLLDHEIKRVLEPCLTSSDVSSEMKEYYTNKKNELQSLYNVITHTVIHL